MDKISNKELRLYMDILIDNYKAVTNQSPSVDTIQYLLWSTFSLRIAKSKIEKNVKHFKKHGKKFIIHNGRIIKVIKKQNTAR